MRQPIFSDYLLLILLSIIWASAFFNIKIATESFGPITIAFFRAFGYLLILNFKNSLKNISKLMANLNYILKFY